MAEAITLHWFRRDLRLSDNAALRLAAESGGAVVPCFVLDDAEEPGFAPGGASRWWLHGSLAALDASLKAQGSRLILRKGPTVAALTTLAAETGASSIHFTRCYEPGAKQLEASLVTACRKAGILLKRYGGNALHEPEAIRSRSDAPYRVFTPFWRACLEAGAPAAPLPAPARLSSPAEWPPTERLEAWRLLPQRPDWAGGLRAAWQPGETGAQSRLIDFLDTAASDYATARDRPDLPGTSRLSPHLHFGEISPRQCWQAARIRSAAHPASEHGVASFLREIGWREFSLHLLFHWPHIADQPFRAEFAQFPWSKDAAANDRNLHAWQHGRTGYPIVDAGMRELWHTGWMHNRVRMIVASFLSKHLLIPWQTGARWFWDTLVDADMASNQASWQWVAGSGVDAAPYFRVFNPILQGSKFDRNGDYVRRFVPELARLPSNHIHAPWLAPREVLDTAGITLGETYPLPIVEHAVGRARALAAYSALEKDGPKFDAEGNSA